MMVHGFSSILVKLCGTPRQLWSASMSSVRGLVAYSTTCPGLGFALNAEPASAWKELFFPSCVSTFASMLSNAARFRFKILDYILSYVIACTINVFIAKSVVPLSPTIIHFYS